MASPLWNQIAGSWKQFKGEVQTQWGKLTMDDVDQIEGQYEKLAGKIQQRYGIAQEEAHRQIDEWAERMKSRTS